MDHYYHFAVRRWIAWTFIAGIVIGVYVLGNLAAWEQTTPVHLRLALIIGAFFWGLFALFAWSADGIEIQLPSFAAVPSRPRGLLHEPWEDHARAEAIRCRAVDLTAESHLSD